MKDKMFKYFTANSTRTHIDILDEFVKRYNNTVHSSIKMTPTEASKRENENQVWRIMYGDYSPLERKAPKFSIDDNVRITKKRNFRERVHATLDRRGFYSVRSSLHRSYKVQVKRFKR